MNKEEIEKAIKILLKEDRFYDDETEIKATKVLLKYIKELEQKESILDKVTEECRKQMKEYEDSILEVFPQKILDIIEGANNGKS